MTAVVTASRARRVVPADAIHLLAGAALLAAINGVSATIFGSFAGFGWRGALLDLSGVSAVFWFALYAIFMLARGEAPRAAPHRGDLWIAAIVVGLACWPSARAAAIGVLISAVYLARRPGSDPRAVPMSVILFALSGMLVAGPVLIALAGPYLLSLDAHFVGWLADVATTGTTVRFAGDQDVFTIGVPCSSIHNVSLAVILWASLTQLLDYRVTPRLIALCGAAMAAMIVVNGLRLAAIAHYRGSFDWLHDGLGAQLFGWASLAAAGLVIGVGLVAMRDDRS
jgi:exosortase/archaeosortase family protein